MGLSLRWTRCAVLLVAAVFAVTNFGFCDAKSTEDYSSFQRKMVRLVHRLQSDPAMVAELYSQTETPAAVDTPETAQRAVGTLRNDSSSSSGSNSSSSSSSSSSDSSSSQKSKSRAVGCDEGDGNIMCDPHQSKQNSKPNSIERTKDVTDGFIPREPQIDTSGNDLADNGQDAMSYLNVAKFKKDRLDPPVQDRTERKPHFPCPPLQASPEGTPRSVHRLRPSDVSVVAAMGDSLTAARGAGEREFLAMLFDYRGLSWSIGGDGSYRDFTSLPNILREYNPELYGFSNGRDIDSPGLNVAISAATSNSLVSQTKRLIIKMKQDPNVDFQRDWKVITVFIGGNDVCRACYNGRLTADNYAGNLRAALDLLHDTVPRAFVNVVELMKVEMAPEIARQNGVCENTLDMLCNCLAFPKDDAAFQKNLQLRKDFQKAVEDIVNSGIYDTKKDFTVVLQPFYKESDPPAIETHHTMLTEHHRPHKKERFSETNLTTDAPAPRPKYKIDLTYFAADCFHYSRKGQATAGLNLYNNMLQPVGHKSLKWTSSDRLLCPSHSFPYLATRNNSAELLKHWRQEGLVSGRTGRHSAGPLSVARLSLDSSINAFKKATDSAETITYTEKVNGFEQNANADLMDGDSAIMSSKRYGESAVLQDIPVIDTNGNIDQVTIRPAATIGRVVAALIGSVAGIVGLAGFYIYRKRSRDNLYVQII